MFWRVSGYSQPSPIEGILDKEDFTLEELLDEDDLIQEVKSLNNRLLEFLGRKETVDKLISYFIEPAGDDDDPKRQFKYPYASCEIFACEADSVFATLLDNRELMDRLFGFLNSEAPLNTSLAGYFGRVVGSLLMRKTADLMTYLKAHQEVIENLIKHLQTTSIAEVVVQLVGSDEQSYMYYGTHHMYWLADTSLMQLLIAQLAPEHPPETQANAADILAAIAHVQPSPLASKLSSPEHMGMLFQRALAPEGSEVLVPALNVCIALLEPKRTNVEGGHGAGTGMGTGTGETGNSGSGGNTALKAAAVTGILSQINRLVALLSDPKTASSGWPGKAGSLKTTYGELQPRLGSKRWKVVELLAVLAAAGGAGVEEALIQHQAVKTCMDLFVQYPFNNLLHHVGTVMLGACLAGTTAMLTHLIKDCDLPGWLASAPASVESTNGSGPLRAGYMGHITTLGNALVDLGRRKPEVKAMLSANDQWSLFVSTTLQERNEVQNVSKWACGRPTTLGNMDSDGEDLQNDLDLENLAGGGHDVYNRYEEDDDDDEMEDADVNNDEESPVYYASEDLNSLSLADDKSTPDSWEESVESDSSDSDEGAEAVAPAAAEPMTSAPRDDDDDNVLVCTEAEEEQLAAELVVDGSSAGLPEAAPPVDPPSEIEVEDTDDHSALLTPSKGGSPVSPSKLHDTLSSPKGQATEILEDSGPEFNNFQFWRSEIVYEVPDDV